MKKTAANKKATSEVDYWGFFLIVQCCEKKEKKTGK